MHTCNLDYKQLLDDFLSFKRSAGYKYLSEAIIAKAFYTYTQTHPISKQGLTQKFMDAWATAQLQEGRKSLANRVGVLREFAIYLNMHGYKAYILKPISKANNKQFIPYVFSEKEIANIMQAIDTWPRSQHNSYNSNEVYPVLFRMLYGCGLRISEALNLKIKNVDTISSQIIIDVAKYDKQRIVFMSESLKNIVHEYKIKYLGSKDIDTTFFQHKDGSVRKKHQAGNIFKQLLWMAHIPYLGRGKGPYLHNLRHTFACHSFYKMYMNGIDMNVGISLLSTYLGHESIQSTEKYLRLTQDIFPKLTIDINMISQNIYTEIVDV